MKNEDIKLTSQDIIDKEFRVKFRGFDMAEVDVFLEEVAESFFLLAEENALLHEKVAELQQDLEKASSMGPPGHVEFTAELENVLEDLRHDTANIGTELAAFKQDRQNILTLRDKLEKEIVSLRESATALASQPKADFPDDLASTLQEFKQSAGAVTAEMAARKEDRLAFASLKKSFEDYIQAAKATASSVTPGKGQAGIPADLGKAFADLKTGTETIGTELASLQEKVGTIAGMRGEIKKELQEQLSAHFVELDAKLSAVSVKAAQEPKATPPADKKKEKLPTAEIVAEPEGLEEDTKLPEYRQYEDDASEEGELEFLSEDDILDVDKLRGVFQSVLDEGVSDAHDSREGDDATADLLFLEDFEEDSHEPEVTFSLDEEVTEQKPKPRKH